MAYRRSRRGRGRSSGGARAQIELTLHNLSAWGNSGTEADIWMTFYLPAELGDPVDLSLYYLQYAGYCVGSGDDQCGEDCCTLNLSQMIWDESGGEHSGDIPAGTYPIWCGNSGAGNSEASFSVTADGISAGSGACNNNKTEVTVGCYCDGGCCNYYSYGAADPACTGWNGVCSPTNCCVHTQGGGGGQPGICPKGMTKSQCARWQEGNWQYEKGGRVNTNSRFSGRTQTNPKGKPRK